MQQIRCSICGVHIEADAAPQYCPSCKSLISYPRQDTGMNTAVAVGPGLVPLNDLEQIVY